MTDKVINLKEHQVRRIVCCCGCSELHIDIDETEERAYMSCSRCGRIWHEGEAIN